MKIIDLTKPIRFYPEEPEDMQVKITHYPHSAAARLIRQGGLPGRLFPRGFRGWADDTIRKMPVHGVTHVDAPWHYTAEFNGTKARTIDQMPLEWFTGEGVVIDMTHKKDMEVITKQDVMDAAARDNLAIREGTIVLIRTGRDRLMGRAEYMPTGTGMSAEATEWLVDCGVHVMGIDQWGWDIPLVKSVERIARGEADPETFWAGHRVGARREYCHIEQIVGLDRLPKSGFCVFAFPLPLEGCSASPIRLVAIIDDVNEAGL